AVMLVKRKAFDDIGGFDPDYFFFFEETDLALRLRLAGWRVMHEPSAKCVHLQGRSASAHASAARIEFYRSRYIFFEKFYGSKARRFLKTVIMLNLSINFVTYGAMNLVTLGLSEKLHNKFEIWKALSFWHMAGCPNSVGLPRD
ncbi:MAG: glycosyltransferase family 2 protein, partial [Desulfomonilaceae bacterium]